MDAIVKMREEKIRYVEPTNEAEEKWRKDIADLSDATLFPQTDSWYMGTNIPGKPREQLSYAGGMPLYEETCREALNGWKGFVLQGEAASKL